MSRVFVVLMLAAVLLSLPVPSYAGANYCNGQEAYSLGTHYYPNGQTAYSMGTYYYPNGQTAYSLGTSYYPNGQTMYSLGTYYTDTGVRSQQQLSIMRVEVPSRELSVHPGSSRERHSGNRMS